MHKDDLLAGPLGTFSSTFVGIETYHWLLTDVRTLQEICPVRNWVTAAVEHAKPRRCSAVMQRSLSVFLTWDRASSLWPNDTRQKTFCFTDLTCNIFLSHEQSRVTNETGSCFWYGQEIMFFLFWFWNRKLLVLIWKFTIMNIFFLLHWVLS